MKYMLNEEITFSSILPLLKGKEGNVKTDLLFAKQIVANHSDAVSYFIGDYSTPLLRYIATSILNLKNDYEYGEPCDTILGDYYIFIAAPFDEAIGNNPRWHKIDLYKGTDDARLYSYVSYITKNHFIKEKKKHLNTKEKVSELLEFIDYEALLECDYFDENIDENPSESLQLLHEAFIRLNERDQIVLQYLVMDKMHWSEAFEKLRAYLDPKGPNEEWESWSFEEKQKAINEYWEPKQKQDAMAGLKKRAIAHITSQFYKLKEQKK
jgi:hypothetical protein